MWNSRALTKPSGMALLRRSGLSSSACSTAPVAKFKYASVPDHQAVEDHADDDAPESARGWGLRYIVHGLASDARQPADLAPAPFASASTLAAKAASRLLMPGIECVQRSNTTVL